MIDDYDESVKPLNYDKLVKLSISRKQCGHIVCGYTDRQEVYDLLQISLAKACEVCNDLENQEEMVNPDTIYLCATCNKYSETCITDKEGDRTCEYCGSYFLDKYCMETAYDEFIKHIKNTKK